MPSSSLLQLDHSAVSKLESHQDGARVSILTFAVLWVKAGLSCTVPIRNSFICGTGCLFERHSFVTKKSKEFCF
jgi:hypothetical protein